MIPTLKIVQSADRLPQLMKNVHDLTRKVVLVGVPDERAQREAGDEGEQGPVNNATLAFIHQNGSPAANIPPRPFMTEGAKFGQDKITAGLKRIGDAALDPKTTTEKLNQLYGRLGQDAASAIKRKLTLGPWHELADSTKAFRRRIGKRLDMKPLIFTGQLRAAITWVVRVAGSDRNQLIGPKERE